MFSVGYFIVCINLLYYFDQAETCFPSKTRKVPKLGEFSNSITVENQDDWLVELVCPYWKLTYKEELIVKQNHCRAIVDTIMKRFDRQRAIYNMEFKLHNIIPSPVTKAYRSKDIFNIGIGFDGKPKTVGLRVGNRTIGIYYVRPAKISTIKEIHKRAAQVFEDFIRLSPLPASSDLLDGGYWREIHLRSNLPGKVIATVIVQPRGHSTETIQKQQVELKNYFFKHLPNITLYHQQCPFKSCSHGVAPFVLLRGKPYFMDYVNSYKFKITPAAFFPTNKLGTEVMYDAIIKMAELKPSTTVIDLFSHTGIVSIMLSKHVKESIMVDSATRAVKEGKYIADMNKIHNIKFNFGKEESESLLKNLSASDDIVAIMSPRVRQNDWYTIQLIRDYPLISKLFYVCTQPEGRKVFQHFHILCSYDKERCRPFKLIETIPIDLLPRTKFIQYIFRFQR